MNMVRCHSAQSDRVFFISPSHVTSVSTSRDVSAWTRIVLACGSEISVVGAPGDVYARLKAGKPVGEYQATGRHQIGPS